MPPEGECESQKVEKTRLSRLARWILQNTSDGIERTRIAEDFFEIERFYCGWYVDPCLTPKEKQERDGKNKKAQSLITKTLDRLEQLGLVQLICRQNGRYVKEVRLTEKAKIMAQKLNNTETGRKPAVNRNEGWRSCEAQPAPGPTGRK